MLHSQIMSRKVWGVMESCGFKLKALGKTAKAYATDLRGDEDK